MKYLNKHFLVFSGFLSFFLASCSKEKVIEITEVRESIGEPDKLFAWVEPMPKEWRIIGSLSNAFTRPLVTFAVEKESQVTLTVGLGGDPISNINRWRTQFNKPEYTQLEELEDSQAVEMMGQPALLLKESGDFLGRHKDWAMLVIITEHPKYRIAVMKMVGPRTEIDAQRENFIAVAKNLKFKEDQVQFQ
ncbi:hypothetical protein OAB00_03255 [Akkermansiaceae bacterium]|nr:hypothetical protein [Akkermansiaceae bacterium]